MSDPVPNTRPTLQQWMARQSPARRTLILVGSVILSVLIIWLAIIPLMKQAFDAGQRSVQTPG